MKQKDWPYPQWIAHRGAGLHAPENTLAAFRYGYQAGYRMFECDAKLTADHQIILLHDATLDRTTNGTGLASEVSWDQAQRLDAGQWHSTLYAGEPVATLDRLNAFCQANDCMLNIEIKPVPGHELITGTLIAQAACAAWQECEIKPLLSSFSVDALRAAMEAAPELARAQLMHTLRPQWQSTVNELQCHALICNHEIVSADIVGSVHEMGMRCLSYTVNDELTARRLINLGIDGLITDEVERFDPRNGFKSI
ncbi:glycerophosphodiester phosphodiesterase [Orrella marina]|uniref:Glycerophosphodiester phosphodiesterase n=1 Tax=Orrella marina TaxID=2163011 RepID=A0A2R4XPV3_9BURK|nr:glycerophosphodiester phosphodiesterase [Orrella marina]AWB35788.1 glycerophosphodiester phosphodiesterase [Orrella marina]